MNAEKHAPRLLGAAFLIVAVASLSSGLLRISVVGSGSLSEILVHVSHQLPLMRLSILGELVTSSGIVVLAGLLYLLFRTQHRLIALVALGWWLAEAIMLALSQLGALALLPFSLEFVQAGAPVHSSYQTLGAFLYSGVNGLGMTFHMWFYCIGGLLWYGLFYASKSIPRVISLWGLLTVSVTFVRIVFQLLGVFPFLSYDVSTVVCGLTLSFEFIIGGWLLLRGLKEQPQDEHARASGLATIPTEGRV
jgi:hypothetical protein